jgi:hypothetical protein
MSTLLLSAADFELAPTRQLLDECNTAYTAEIFGVGCHAAAEGATRLADTCRDRDVIFVGTAGTFVRFVKPYLVRSTMVCWLPLCERLEQSYAIANSAPEVTFGTEDPRFGELAPRKVVCAPNVSCNATLPRDWLKEEYVENIELYSVARVLAPVAATFTAILGVTNSIGSLAHDQWRQYAPEAAYLTAEFLHRHLNP